MESFKYCPNCGSENWEFMGDEYEPQEYHCHECDTWFGDETHDEQSNVN